MHVTGSSTKIVKMPIDGEQVSVVVISPEMELRYNGLPEHEKNQFLIVYTRGRPYVFESDGLVRFQNQA
jgi:hypothetical protein